MAKEPAVFKPTWPEGLVQGESYEFPCDDNGADGACYFRVMVANDGDVHLMATEQLERRVKDSATGETLGPIYHSFPSVRCRTHGGGGQHPRTRQALLWLADAIRRDNEELANRYSTPVTE